MILYHNSMIEQILKLKLKLSKYSAQISPNGDNILQ